MVGTAKEQAEELLKRCRLWKQKGEAPLARRLSH